MTRDSKKKPTRSAPASTPKPQATTRPTAALRSARCGARKSSGPSHARSHGRRSGRSSRYENPTMMRTATRAPAATMANSLTRNARLVCDHGFMPLYAFNIATVCTMRRFSGCRTRRCRTNAPAWATPSRAIGCPRSSPPERSASRRRSRRGGCVPGPPADYWCHETARAEIPATPPTSRG